jgi:hypothetical protein
LQLASSRQQQQMLVLRRLCHLLALLQHLLYPSVLHL